MTNTGHATQSRVEQVPIVSGLAVAATLLAVGTIALIWLVAVPFGPEVCSLVYPPDRNCFTSDRVSKGILASAIVFVIYAATMLLALLGGRQRGLVMAGVLVLTIGPVVAYLFVAWIPAFA